MLIPTLVISVNLVLGEDTDLIRAEVINCLNIFLTWSDFDTVSHGVSLTRFVLYFINATDLQWLSQVYVQLLVVFLFTVAFVYLGFGLDFALPSDFLQL